MAAVTEDVFLGYLDDLTGKVALVTGGAGTIGLQAAQYLAARGCLVYIADTAPRLADLQSPGAKYDWAFFAGQGKGVENKYPDRMRNHPLDLSSVNTATESATDFLSKENRLDIVVASAAVMGMSQSQLSPDGWERTWAIAHIGHVTFINCLLPLLRKSAASSRPSRIVFITSNSYESASAPDYELLRRELPNDLHAPGFMKRMFERYQLSKLGNVYYATELAKRIGEEMEGEERAPILVNCSHPGVNPRTHLAHSVLPVWLESMVKGVLGLLGHTPRDCAKTGVFLAASADIRLRRITGEFWTPSWNWFGYWTACNKVPLTPLAQDTGKRLECWERTEAAIAAARF